MRTRLALVGLVALVSCSTSEPAPGLVQSQDTTANTGTSTSTSAPQTGEGESSSTSTSRPGVAETAEPRATEDDGTTTGQMSASSRGTSSEAGGSSEGDDGPVFRFDVANSGTGDVYEQGCQKVDFLFVIDASGSTRDEQDALRASVPGFIEQIEATTDVRDFHVMVVDTNDGELAPFLYAGFPLCEPSPTCCEALCNPEPPAEPEETCNDIPCDMIPSSPCEAALGAGNLYRSDGTRCVPPETESRYLTAGDDFAEQFECITQLGELGNRQEQVAGAMLGALSRGQDTLAGLCNIGFLRDDAVLVVTFVTDSDDDHSVGEPLEWYDALVEAKNGFEDSIVVLGLYGDTDQPDALCDEPDNGQGASAGPRLRAFVEAFGDNGLSSSVCADDFSPFFASAVDTIDATCDAFMPPG